VFWVFWSLKKKLLVLLSVFFFAWLKKFVMAGCLRRSPAIFELATNPLIVVEYFPADQHIKNVAVIDTGQCYDYYFRRFSSILG
jgi:hypothetical protein